MSSLWIAWLWARTVKSPNPAYSHVDVPLVSTFMLSTKKGKEAYVEPVIEGDSYRFEVRAGAPPDLVATKAGTGAGQRKAFRCLMSGTPITYDYVRREGQAGRLGVRLMAIVSQGDRSRVYLPPVQQHVEVSAEASPGWQPDIRLEGKTRVNVSNYGLKHLGDLFTPRQLVALTTFSDLVGKAMPRVRRTRSLLASPTTTGRYATAAPAPGRMPRRSRVSGVRCRLMQRTIGRQSLLRQRDSAAERSLDKPSP